MQRETRQPAIEPDRAGTREVPAVIPPPPADQHQKPPGVVALNTLAFIAVLFTIYLAAGVLLPLMYALVIWLTLRPVVRWLGRRRIPAIVSSAVIIGLLAGLMLTLMFSLVTPARQWIAAAPQALAKAGERLAVVRERIQQFNAASQKLEDLASGRDTEPKEEQSTWSRVVAALDGNRETSPLEEEGDQPVQVEVSQPALPSKLSMLTSAGSLTATVFVISVLSFFLLSSGDVLLNNTLRVLPSFREKRLTVELVRSIEQRISFYLLNVTAINAGLGVAIGLAMWPLGMPNPALWGLMAAILNFMPFLGALIGTVVVFLVAVVTFDSLAWAATVPAVYFGLTALEGNVVTPGLLGRSLSLNPILVFLSLVVWGWMWGAGGVLLAVPVLAIIRAGCGHFERTKAISTLLSGSS